MESELAGLRNQYCDMQNDIACKSATICKLQEEVESLKQDYQCAELKNKELRSDIAEYQATIDRLQRKM